MKDICISGYGVSTHTFQYGFNITSVELAKLVGLSVVAVEAMTEDEVKALMLGHKHILNKAAYEGKAELDWPYNPEYIVNDDFEVEEGE
jgi:D-arabinose 1-dehydrogenase-like Zn-dependent alcohol dehydrogenase